ncbi:hypothetical protein [Streptomyces canus]|uniref:hypothetical protein n=1 Tax=Streptomyces canus TaxID=58343 RepID=UPI0018F8884D|nr:hypothetical protein [Streptomyces canus]
MLQPVTAVVSSRACIGSWARARQEKADCLALVVVDRLQAAHSARLPLSGPRLPDAFQVLATLARTLHVPVLALVDSDDPALLGLLDADVTLTLAPTDDPARVQVTVAQRDFGTIGSAYLKPDLVHARFLNAGAAPADRTTARRDRGSRRPPAERRRRWNWPKPRLPTPPAAGRSTCRTCSKQPSGSSRP